jgi:tRNA threonylcarbamoyladenosine biosynthesis protein TsaB
MKILGFDTCTETIDVALVENDVLLAEKRQEAPRKQLTMLVPMIAEIFDATNNVIGNTDLIALTTGPGSFTGTRLGLATAQTLAQVNDIPLAPVNTLDAVAAGFNEDGIVIPSMDARKSEVFFAVFEKNGEDLKLLEPHRRVHLDEYFRFINGMEYENPAVIGSVFKRYSDIFSQKVDKKIRTAPELYWTPRGETIAGMGRKMMEQGRAVNYMQLQAHYGREFETNPPKPVVGS